MLCPELPPRIYESLRTLCCLAAANRPLQAQEIALASSLPPAQTAKLLQQMTSGGFVWSRRGAKGGFWLRKPAASIRVTDVAAFFCRPAELQRNDPVRQALAHATTPWNAALDAAFQPLMLAAKLRGLRWRPIYPEALKF